MAPKYILNYFPAAGRAEPIRILFHAAGVEFTDNRMAGEEWAKSKPDSRRFPFGQMPTLEVDDKVICQSQAIWRYVARETGQYGSNSYEAAVIDQVTETLSDIGNTVIPILFLTPDEEEKKKKFADFFGGDTLKKQLTFLENILNNNNGGNGFFVGEKLSLADAIFYGNSLFLVPVNPNYLDTFPNLKALIERVKHVEGVKQYLDSQKK